LRTNLNTFYTRTFLKTENYDERLFYIQAYTLHLQHNDCIQIAVSGL